MESSSRVEEGSSSKSGWTMYIVSPTHESPEEEVESEYSRGRVSRCRNRAKKEEDEDYDDGEDDSDDSMVSDASSGPSYRGIPQRRGGRMWRRKEKKGMEKEGRRRKEWAEKEEGGRTPIRPVSAASRARR